MFRYQLPAILVAISLITVPAPMLTRSSVEAHAFATPRGNPLNETFSVTEGALSKPSSHTPAWIAYEYLDRMRSHYGLRRPRKEMSIRQMHRQKDGSYCVHMQQMLHGTPVYGGELTLDLNADGVVRKAEGTVYPRLSERVYKAFPTLTFKRAEQRARRAYNGTGQLRAQPASSLYYLPTRPGVPLVYDFTFQIEGASDGSTVYRARVHAVMGHVLQKPIEGEAGDAR